MKIANAIVPASMFAAAALFVLTPAELTQAQGPGARPDLDAIKRDYRRPAPRPVENQLLVDLGRTLFFDPRISASGKTACASCHFPELGYVVTDAHPLNDSGKPTSRKSQPLIGLGYAGNAAVGWDGRSATLEVQAKASKHRSRLRRSRSGSDRLLTMRQSSTRLCRASRSTSMRSHRPWRRSSAPWSRGLPRSIGGSAARWQRSPNQPNVDSRFSPARPAAPRAIAVGDSPMTSSTISAPRRPIRAAAARSRMPR